MNNLKHYIDMAVRREIRRVSDGDGDEIYYLSKCLDQCATWMKTESEKLKQAHSKFVNSHGTRKAAEVYEKAVDRSISNLKPIYEDGMEKLKQLKKLLGQWMA